MKEITAVDLCAGCGGWAVAARGLPIRWVAVADWKEDCLETWVMNHGDVHPDCHILRCDLSTEEGVAQVLAACAGQRIDLVVGGIPCEQVSTARANRKLKEGELETLHALIDNCFGLVKELAPRWWCFENVEAIETHLPDPLFFGRAFDVRKICAADHGPQKRYRVFIGDYPPLAEPEPGPRTLGEILRPGPYRTLPGLDRYRRSRSKWYGQGGEKVCRVQDLDSPAGTVISSQGGCGSNAERSAMVPLKQQLMDPAEPSRIIFAGGHGQSTRSVEGLLVSQPVARVLDAGEPCPTVADFGSRHERAALVSAAARPRQDEKVQEGAAPSLTVTNGAKESQIVAVSASVAQNDLVRVLEWQEAALLQGFPEDYVFAASWSRVWKLIAQAIPIQVGSAILRGVVQVWKAGAE